MANKIKMTAVVHPFKLERKRLEFDEGATIKDMVVYAQPDATKLRHAIVFINGRVIPKNMWGEHKPKGGELVEVRAFPIPHGGDTGKSILRIVASIAIMVVALYAGGAAVSWLGLQAGSTMATVVSGVVAGVVYSAGMLAVNALCPVSTKNSAASLSGATTTDSNTLYIEGASNSLNPFSPVPVILGKYRSTPPLGSKPYTEMIGNDQFIRMLFVWGIGPVDIDESSIKIGDTLLTDFTDYQIEHREGYADDEPLTLFPSAISEEDFTIALKSVTDWVTRTTTINADEISLDISFSGGLVQYDNLGNKQSVSVNVEIEYRKTGSGDEWSKIDTSNAKFQTTIDSSWFDKTYDLLDNITFTGQKSSAVRYGIRWGVAERTQYDVRVRRTTADTSSSMIADLTFWTALRSITAEGPVNSPVPIAMTALVIKATDQLNGIINNFSAVVTRVCNDWDVATQTWIERATQNPASLFRFILQGNGMALPIVDSRIDLDTLQDWHEWCVSKGFKFNMIRDYTSSVWDVLRDICAAGRAAPTLIDGKWSVVIDREQTAPVSVITPRNSFEMSGEKFFLDPPHGWRIQFPNEDEDYRTDEYRVYRDGYDDNNATKFETLDLLGVTDPDQIYRLGRWRIAQVLNQPERWTFKQDMEFLTYRRGDWVKIAHDVMIVGLSQGRVKSVTLNEEKSVISVELDEEVAMETGKDYGVNIRTLDNPSLSSQVITVDGVSKTLIFSDPIVGVGSPLEQAINVGDIFCFGEFGEETEDATIISISPTSSLQATIIAIPYRPAIYACDTEEIPEFVTKINPHILIPAPNIISIVSGEDAMVVSSTGTVKIRIGIIFDPLDTTVWGTGSVVIVQIRHSGTEEAYYPAVIEEQGEGYVFIGDVRPEEVVDIRLRFKVNGRLLPGPWTTTLAYSVLGNAIPPADVANFTYTFLKELVMSWDKNKLWGDLAGYEIRNEDDNWGSIIVPPIYSGYATTFTIPSPSSRAPGTYYIKVFNTSGIYSTNAVSIIPTNAAPVAPSVSATQWFGFAKIEWSDVGDIDLSFYEVYKSSTNAWAGEEILDTKTPGRSVSVQGNSPIDVVAASPDATSITDALLIGKGVNYFVGDVLLQTSGTCKGQESVITTFDNDTGKVTVASWETGTPDALDKFVIKDRAYYKVRAVDRYGPGSFSSAVTIDFAPLTEAEIGDAIISARKLIAGEVITLTAQIKDLIVTDAKISDLDGGKITANSIHVTKLNADAVPPKTYYQATEPSTGMRAGDYWVDTDDGNKIHIYQDTTSPASWEPVGAGAVGGGITTFAQDSIPTSVTAGDLWLDTNDGNKLYRATNAGDTTIAAGHWVLVRDSASATVDSWRASGDDTYIDGGDIYTGTITAGSIAAGAVTADKITVDDAIDVGDGSVVIDGANDCVSVFDDQETPVERVKIGKLS